MKQPWIIAPQTRARMISKGSSEHLVGTTWRPILDAAGIPYGAFSTNKEEKGGLLINKHTLYALQQLTGLALTMLGAPGISTQGAYDALTQTPAFVELSTMLLGAKTWDEDRAGTLRAEATLLAHHFTERDRG